MVRMYGRSLRGNVDWNIHITVVYQITSLSFPSRERGLKLTWDGVVGLYPSSFPSRERGLKWYRKVLYRWTGRSFPSRERGLKYFFVYLWRNFIRVVPFAGTWIEIHLPYAGIHRTICRSLRGNVDWNCQQWFYLHVTTVVPFAGTWIEIYLHVLRCERESKSFPSRERGLKSYDNTI